MIKVNVYNQEGKKVSERELPEEIFNEAWNPELLHFVIVAMRSNMRAGTAHTKFRGEVSGGGRKPWRQKGTGRARHGSIRSPLWRGGGVTHGPRTERDYKQKINKRMKRKALFVALSQKLREEELVFLDKLVFDEPRTKAAQRLLHVLAQEGFEKIDYKVGKRVLIVTPQKSNVIEKSFRNIPSAAIEEVRNLSPLDVVTYKYILFSDISACVSVLHERLKKALYHGRRGMNNEKKAFAQNAVSATVK